MTKRSRCKNALGVCIFKRPSLGVFYAVFQTFSMGLTSRCSNLLSNDSCISFPISFHIALLVLFGIMFQTMTYTQILASTCVTKGTQPEAITVPLPAPAFGCQVQCSLR